MGFREEIDKLFGQIRQTAGNVVNADLNKTAPGVQSIGGAVSNWQQFTPLSMRSQAVPLATSVGKSFGNQQLGNDIGYGLRGALSLTPFQSPKNVPLVGKYLPGQQIQNAERLSNPVTNRQKIAQAGGQAAYGTLLTAPLGAGKTALQTAANITRNTLGGVGTGALMQAGTDLLSGKNITKQSLIEGGVSGLQNSWVLPITNKMTDTVLSSLSKLPIASGLKKIVGSAATDPFKQGKIKEGFVRVLSQSLAQVPLENTAFTALNQLNDQDSEEFTQAWLKNLPGSVLSNIIGAGVSTGTNVVINKESRDAVIKAATDALTKPTWTYQLEQSGNYKWTKLPWWESKIKNPKLGLSVEPINPDEKLKLQNKSNIAQSTLSDIKPTVETRTLPKVAKMGQKQPLPVEVTTKTQAPLKQPTTKPVTMGGDQQSIPSRPIISEDPVTKIIAALKEAKPIRGKQEALYSKARSQQAAKIIAMGGKVKGEQGYFAQLGQLKGALPKAQFEGIRNKIKQPEIDSLFNMIEQKNVFSPFEKVNAKTALSKLLGAEGGTVPTKSELRLLNEVFPPELTQTILDKRPLFQKLLSLGVDAINLPKSIMASADLSAPLRQGIFLVGRPKQWVPAFKEMFKYAGSEDAYKGLAEQIQSRPTYKLMRQTKLALTDVGEGLSSREEAMMSTLPEKIPGFGVLYKASNRAYSGFLNKLRADTFDSLVSGAKQQGLNIDEIAPSIANFVSTATGRGNLGMFSKAAEILNGTMFAPRLVASRVSLLNPIYYAKLDPYVRKEALKSLFTFVGMGSAVLGLAKLGGAQVENDPTSSDFGKIKVGNTRYDIWGGFQQYVKLAAQLAEGQIKSSTTGKIMTLGEGYKPMTRKDILIRFFEGKESPVASFITKLITGQTSTGEPVNIPSEIIGSFIPLLAQDLYDLYNEYGPKGLAMGTPGLFGVGSQTYGKTEFVTGKNKIGEPSSQVRPIQDLPTQITEKIMGKLPLGSSSSWNAETYYNQLLKLPKAEAAAKWDEMAKTNPDLVKKMAKIVKDRKAGVTVQNEQLKLKGVQSGDRALSIAKEFKKLKTNQEKAALWNDYVKKGIITKDVAKQLQGLLK